MRSPLLCLLGMILLAGCSGGGDGLVAEHDIQGSAEIKITPPLELTQNDSGCWGTLENGSFQTVVLPRGAAVPNGDELTVNGKVLKAGGTVQQVYIDPVPASFPDGCPEDGAVFITLP